MKSSGIGGQAVIEGVMMRNKDEYAVAVRKPDKEIEIKKEKCSDPKSRNTFLKLPLVRGVVAFIESLKLGMKTLTFSASFLEEEEENDKNQKKKESKIPVEEKKKDEAKENILMGLTVMLSVVIAIAIFVLLPFFISEALRKVIPSIQLRGLIEGVIRVALFVGYVKAISLMQDIKRVFMYHGAEHKTINCVENGLELTVENVRKQSKCHKRCGTSFLLIVMLISILFFLFIVVDNMWLRMVLRLLLIPVVAGVAYEFIRLAGNSDSKVIAVLSKPGFWLQSLTTSEPEDDMIEVAIASVDAVFDWKSYIAQVQEEQAKEALEEQEEAALEEQEEALEEQEEEAVAEEIEEETSVEKDSIEEKAVEETAAVEEEEVSEDLEMVGLEETEEDDEILKNLDYVFTSPEVEEK